MQAFARIAEERIREAIAKGDLDRLPGCGRPLVLDDDSGVPEELRMAWRVLKNAGLVPQEVGIRRAIGDLEASLEALCDPGERAVAERRLAVLRTRLEARGGSLLGHGYGQALRRRFAGR